MRTPFDRFTAPQEEARLRSLVDRVCPSWVTPNGITYFRLACVPVILVLMTDGGWSWTAALVLYIAAMILDAVDGPLARARNQVTDHGKLLDAIVDKAVVFLPFWSCWLLTGSATWSAGLLIGVGAILTIIECELLRIRLYALVSPPPPSAVPQANGVGKAKVWVEGWMVGVALVGPREPIAHSIASALAIAAIGLAYWSLRVHHRTR
mgnify:CR=1 FL=1